MVPTGLPCILRVIAQFVPLNPRSGLGEKIDSAHVVPMGVADHHVGNLLGFNARQANGLIGAQVILDRPFLEPALPVKTTVEENISPASADQPQSVNGIYFFALGRTDD